MRNVSAGMILTLAASQFVASQALSATWLDQLTTDGCELRGSFEAMFPTDADGPARIPVSYLLLQCKDGKIHACTVTVEKTVDQIREVGLISNFCFPITSKGNN